MIDFDSTPNRKTTNSVKWNQDAIESISANKEAEPFWVADMDFYPEPHIKAKAKELSSLSVFGYPTFPSFLDIASSWLEKKHKWIVNKKSITFSMGLLHGISLAINLFSKEGDKILIPSPTYRPFRELCSLNHRVMEECPLAYKNGEFSLDREEFLKSARKSNMIIFCSPHNPSGLVFSSEDLNFVLECAKSLNIPVLSDEIHGDLVHPNAHHIPMGKANEKVGANVITFMAPSKTFNVAGEHSAIAIFSSLEMKERFEKAEEALWLTTPGFLIGELTQTAYKEGLEWNEALCSYLGDTAKAMKAYLKKNLPMIKMANANSSFVTFLDCREIYEKVKSYVDANPEKYHSEEGGVLSRFFGVEAGVALNDGTWFGEQYYAFVRFNYGTKRESVINALERMKEAVERLR